LSSLDSNGGPSGAASFDTTHWTVVSAAANSVSPNAAAALETLCRTYWYPLYAYIRRKGYLPADAEDMTQEFFCRLIAKNYLRSADRSMGSFRSFLLACVNHLLANEWDKARALKRGGTREFISLNSEEAEKRFTREACESDTPERDFDRRWALTLLDQAMARLRVEFTQAGKLRQFDLLKGYLSDLAGEGEYAAIAESLELDANGVATAVYRLRTTARLSAPKSPKPSRVSRNSPPRWIIYSGSLIERGLPGLSRQVHALE
jgi:RNA polymerase sigma factor (sigma-70 family)